MSESCHYMGLFVFLKWIGLMSIAMWTETESQFNKSSQPTSNVCMCLELRHDSSCYLGHVPMVLLNYFRCSAEGYSADPSSHQTAGLRERAGWAVRRLPAGQTEMENRCELHHCASELMKKCHTLQVASIPLLLYQYRINNINNHWTLWLYHS